MRRPPFSLTSHMVPLPDIDEKKLRMEERRFARESLLEELPQEALTPLAEQPTLQDPEDFTLDDLTPGEVPSAFCQSLWAVFAQPRPRELPADALEPLEPSEPEEVIPEMLDLGDALHAMGVRVHGVGRR